MTSTEQEQLARQSGVSAAVVVSPRRIVQVLISVVALLSLANAGVLFGKYYLGHEVMLGFVRLFSFDEELNIPTWYSSSALLLASALLAIIAIAKRQARDRFRRYWLGLALIFLYLSLDEAASIHEMAIAPLHEALNTGGVLYYAWVIPGAVFTLGVLLAYLRFLTRLPRSITALFLVGGALFVTGALGMELVGGWYDELHGRDNLTYGLITMCEELLEMLGIIVFIYGLLLYISAHVQPIEIRMAPQNTPLPRRRPRYRISRR